MRVRWSVRFSPCSLSARLSIGIRTKTPVYIPFSQVFVENPLPQRLSAPQTTPNPHHHCVPQLAQTVHDRSSRRLLTVPVTSASVRPASPSLSFCSDDRHSIHVWIGCGATWRKNQAEAGTVLAGG